MRIIACILALAAPAAAIMGVQRLDRLRSLLLEDIKPLSTMGSVTPFVGPVAQLFSQPQDHNDVFNTNVFNQRYFVNDTFFVPGSDAPVFLCVGGEGPALQPTVVTGDVHCSDMVNLGAELGALLIGLEHRFYGSSIPTPDYTTESLKFLTSEQALADLARFVKIYYAEHDLSFSRNRLVTWGGSYPGMMAGFARLKYPHLVFAAVSASSPVKAQVHFTGYMDVVGDSLAATSVGGSEACRQTITDAFAHVGALLQTESGRDQLAKSFFICGGGEALNSFEAGRALTDTLSSIFPLQSNDPLCKIPGCNYESICKIALSANDSMDGLVQLAAAVYKRSPQICLPLYIDDGSSLLDTTLKGGQNRVWEWQTCNEFGYYQTCDPGTGCPFTSEPHYNNLQFYLDQCKLAYGLTEEMVYNRVANSNLYYGADHPVADRILYVNGEVDPWHALAVLKSLPGQPAFVIPGASHHQWTHPFVAGDSKALNHGREEIFHIVKSWLNHGSQKISLTEY